MSAGVADALLASLDGRTFVSTSVTGHDLVEGSTLSVAFEDGRVAVNGGGNVQGSQAVLEGTTLRFAHPPISTRMWPGEELQAQDDWISEIFLSGVDVALEGPDLTLTTGDVTIELAEAPEESDPSEEQTQDEG